MIEDVGIHPAEAALRRQTPSRPRGGRVLVTVDTSRACLAVVRGLRAAGYEPWLAAWQPWTFSHHSRAIAGVTTVADPARDAEGFARTVAERAAELSVAAVVPGTENSLLPLAGAAPLFTRDVVLAGCSPEMAALLTDKASLPRLAASAGLATPPHVGLVYRELEARQNEISFPVVVKPVRSEIPAADGSLQRIEARRVDDFAGVAAAIGSLPDVRWLVQPYLEGDLIGIAGVMWDGELVCALHQDMPRTWPLDSGTAAYAVTVAPDRQLERAVAAMLGGAGWSGIFQLDFIRANDELWLIDINPRAYRSLGLALAAGMNLPAVWVDLLLGRQPRIRGYRVGVGWRDEFLDARALGRGIVRGPRRAALLDALPRRGTTHPVFSLRDPMPAVGRITWPFRRRIAPLRRETGTAGAAPASLPRVTSRGSTNGEAAMRITLARGRSAHELLDESWDALARRQPAPNPTLGSVWLGGLLERDPGNALVARAEVAGRLVAAGAFTCRRLTRWGGPQIVTFRFEGRGPLTAPDLLGDAGRPDAAAAVMEAVLGESFAALLGPAPAGGQLAEAMKLAAPWSSSHPDPHGTWQLWLDRAGLARPRREMNRCLRVADRAGARVEIRTAEDPSDVAQALERLLELHRRRWQGHRHDVARFSRTPADRGWHRRVVVRMAERGEARILEVVEDGVVVAALLLLITGRGAELKTMAVRLGGRLRGPGNVALLAGVDVAKAVGAEVVHLGSGRGVHKERFHPEAAPASHWAAASSAARQPSLDAVLALEWTARQRLARSRWGRARHAQ